MKNDTGKSKALVWLLTVLTAKYWHVTMDTMTDLPEFNRYTAVIVFGDRFTKFRNFVPATRKIPAREYAHYCFDKVVCTYKLPKAITSDRDPRFIENFWRELFRLMDAKFKSSTAHHRQTDEQSEVTLWILKNVLNSYVENRSKSWNDYLKAMETTVNVPVIQSKRYLPYYSLYGTHSRKWTMQNLQTNFPTFKEMTEGINRTRTEARNWYLQAQENMTNFVDRKWRAQEYSERDKELLQTEDITPRRLKKALKKIEGAILWPIPCR